MGDELWEPVDWAQCTVILARGAHDMRVFLQDLDSERGGTEAGIAVSYGRRRLGVSILGVVFSLQEGKLFAC